MNIWDSSVYPGQCGPRTKVLKTVDAQDEALNQLKLIVTNDKGVRVPPLGFHCFGLAEPLPLAFEEQVALRCHL